jgi:uncharacterized membrane protein
MSSERRGWSDEQVERFVGNLLRIGVLSAGSVVLLGGVVFLIRHGLETVVPSQFKEARVSLRSVPGIASEVVDFSGRGLIQLGLVLLIATPIARVIFSVFAFARQRDWTYVVITLIVLGVLAVSLVSGNAEGGRERSGNRYNDGVLSSPKGWPSHESQDPSPGNNTGGRDRIGAAWSLPGERLVDQPCSVELRSRPER